jgi:hypothetical protein
MGAFAQKFHTEAHLTYAFTCTSSRVYVFCVGKVHVYFLETDKYMHNERDACL